MEPETIDTLLANHPFFAGLGESTLKFIAGCGRNVHFDAGDYICREGDEADRFYALRHGRAAIEIHVPGRGAITIQTVHEGEMLGWSWLFPSHKWQFDVRAIEVVRATSFDGNCLRGKCDGDPALGYEMMKRLAHVVEQRLEATRLQLLDLYAPPSRA